MFSLLAKFFKFSLWLIVIITVLVLTLNYASYFYRYPAFKWFSSLIEDQFVIQKIGSIEINPSGFSSTISLKGLRFYNKKIGKEFGVKLDQIQGKISLANYWKNKVLFEKISINNLSTNLKTILALIINNPQYQKSEFYKSLEIYLPDQIISKNNQSSQKINTATNTKTIKNLYLSNRWIKSITSRIELINSKLLFGDNEIEIKSAQIDLLDNTSRIKAELSLNKKDSFEINLVINKESKNIIFTIHQIPLSKLLKTTQNFDFLKSDFSANIQGFFDYKNMVLQLNNFDLINPLVQINGSAKYQHRANRRLEIAANITNTLLVKNFIKFWPKSLFNKKINLRVGSAFDQGKITKLSFVFAASLNELNQIKTKKLFNFDIEAKGISLNFGPNWHKLKNLDTKIKVNNLGIVINARGNQINANQIKINAEIASFYQNPNLKVKININSDHDYITQFIKQSPLKNNPKLSPFVDFALNGKAISQIKLNIPLIGQQEIGFSGKVKLINNSLLINKWLEIKKMNGEINFDSNHISSTFNAIWWQNPIKVSLYNQGKNQLKIDYTLNLITGTSIDNLINYLEVKNPKIIDQIKRNISGQSQFTGSILAINKNLGGQKKQLNNNPLSNFNLTIQMSSSLEGISLDWIYPFKKQKKENAQTNFKVTYLDGKLKLQNFQFKKDINITRIKGTDSEIIDMSIIDLNLDAKKIKELIGFLPKRSRKQKIQQKPLYQFDLPNLDLTIYRLRYGGRDVGALSAKLRITKDMALIKDLQLNTSTIQLLGEIKSDSSQTRLNIQSQKNRPLSDYFNYLAIKPITSSALSNINLDIFWPGQIWDYETKDVIGKMEVKTKSGVLLVDSESSFIPRLIKELSVSSIKDRLLNILSFKKIVESLNPASIFKDGIEFDNLNIKLNFKKNKIFTTLMKFNSKAINISIDGYTDLSDESLHYNAIASPDIFKILPLIGLITANLPIALVGILSENFVDTKEFIKVNYKISGDTNNPIIEIITPK